MWGGGIEPSLAPQKNNRWNTIERLLTINVLNILTISVTGRDNQDIDLKYKRI